MPWPGLPHEVVKSIRLDSVCLMQESVTEPPGVLFAPGACTEMAVDAEKAGADASQQDPRAMPGEPSLKELVASEEMAKAAEKHGILWARVKGFPYWPVSSIPHPLALQSFLACSASP